ncbi:polyprenyl diphosphate synthase [Candidatus Saccharibacteria bacterium]|nr:polyprenyl diphosphate synthase [Candidatus Saccharibacteria bacterium]
MLHHIGFIVDGNRRWAKERGLPTLEGHRRGLDALMEVIEACFESGIEIVSAYIFSTENWDRSQKEISYLMELFEVMFDQQVKALHEKGVKVCFLGSRTYNVSPKLVKLIEEAENLTKDNTKKTLALCFNYGGQLELAEAAQKIVGGGFRQEDITPELIAQHLYHPEIPPVDFLVRTSGEQRISNFMLWRIAYAEMFFPSKAWPEMTREDVPLLIKEFSRRQRRFGGN